MNGHDISVFKAAHNAVNFIIINPGAACLQGAALALFQSYYCVIHIFLLYIINFRL